MAPATAEAGNYVERLAAVPAEYAAAPAASVCQRLLILNILLQIFDGVATCNGVTLGIRERNPLLHAAFEFWGVGATLLMCKSCACATLVLVFTRAREELARTALGFVAGVYCIASLIPWWVALFTLLVRS